jgi:hypothetical protein
MMFGVELSESFGYSVSQPRSATVAISTNKHTSFKFANRPHVYTPQFWRVPPPSVLLLHALSEGDILQQSANKVGPVE